MFRAPKCSNIRHMTILNGNNLVLFFEVKIEFICFCNTYNYLFFCYQFYEVIFYFIGLFSLQTPR